MTKKFHCFFLSEKKNPYQKQPSNATSLVVVKLRFEKMQVVHRDLLSYEDGVKIWLL